MTNLEVSTALYIAYNTGGRRLPYLEKLWTDDVVHFALITGIYSNGVVIRLDSISDGRL